MFYFVFISFEKAAGLPGRFKSKAAAALYRIPVLLFINFQWVLFNSNGLAESLRYIRNMFIARDPLSDMRTLVLLKQ